MQVVSKLSYQKWAFRLMLYSTILMAVLIVKPIYGFVMLLVSMLINALVVAGLVCMYYSVKLLEDKSYQFYCALLGFTLYIILVLVQFFVVF